MTEAIEKVTWIDVKECPLCKAGADWHSEFDEFLDGEQRIVFRMCRKCGLVFQSPRMSEHERQAYYQGAYRAEVQGLEGPTEKDLRVQSGRARNLVAYIERHLPTVGRHLDIGSSAGSLMREIEASFAAKSIGVEPGAAYRRYSAEKGSITVEMLDDLPDERFDLITMAHVLEHLPEPVEYLARLRTNRMTPDGILLIEVPNLFGHQSLEVSHDIAFSRQTMRETFRKAGFQVIDLKVHGAPRSRLLGLYLTGLGRASSQPNADYVVQASSRTVRLRRRVGNLRRRVFARLAPGLAWLPYPELEFSE